MNNPAGPLIPLVADIPDPSRREAIKQLALLCGLALSTTALSSLASTAWSPTDMGRSGKTFFDKSQLALVRQLGEIIIPTTDTPGAIAAGVHDFMNHFMVYCADKHQQQSLREFLDRAESTTNKTHGKPFLAITPGQQIDLLTNMEQAIAGFEQRDRENFKYFKSLVLFGYYTSEIGATQELAYLAIPGGYRGNVKFTDVGKAWALPQ